MVGLYIQVAKSDSRDLHETQKVNRKVEAEKGEHNLNIPLKGWKGYEPKTHFHPIVERKDENAVEETMTGAEESTVGALVLDNLGSNPRILYGYLALSGLISESRSGESLEHCQMCSALQKINFFKKETNGAREIA